MGNSTGSMFYMFILIIVVYIIGILIFQGYQVITKYIMKRKYINTDSRKEE